MNALPAKRVLATAAQVAALNAVLARVPTADKEADQSLATSLRLHGQLAPILRRGGQIVDGRRRMAALTHAGATPWIIDLPVDAATSGQALLGRSFFELNACRREFSLGVRAAIADALATLKKGANQHGAITGMSREDAARAVGVSADTLDRYRKIKAIKDVHEKVLSGQMSLPQAVRTVESRAIAAEVKKTIAASGDAQQHLDQLSVRNVVFNLLYADPPWDYEVKGGPSTYPAAPSRHYPTMPLAAIKALPVARIAAKNAVLWLWAPNSYLQRAMDVIEAWGFEYVTSAVWVKRKGSPTWGAVRPMHETLLMARRGQGLVTKGQAAMKSAYIDADVVTMHSRKPVHFAQELERLYPDAGKLELFSRHARPGWVALGNQIERVPRTDGAANDDDRRAKNPAKREAESVTKVSNQKTNRSKSGKNAASKHG
ncbi:Spo0J and IME4 domain-containing protein [Dokdonella sp.]|uniref:Spo0J and IME4 domain-containing protein n=1 Tax=Dokdonella sp. TaxID=2291710 RepID=UPI003784EE41